MEYTMSSGFVDEIKRVIESSIPTSSGIVAKVINTILNHSATAKDLADVIEHDPPLTARILKVANSTYYGASSGISSLQRAVVVLGFDTIKELATTVAFFNSLSQKTANDIDLKGLWYHSTGTANACHSVASHMRIERPDVAYIAGLLHDIGKIIMALSFPDHYRNALNLAAIQQTPIIQAEQKLFNIDHTMIGKVLSDMWRLPNTIGTAILYHHSPSDISKGSQTLARVTELGDFICRKIKIGNPGDNLAPTPSRETLALMGASPTLCKENYKIVFQRVFQSKAEIESFFSVL